MCDATPVLKFLISTPTNGFTATCIPRKGMLFRIPEDVRAVVTPSQLMAFNIAIQHAISEAVLEPGTKDYIICSKQYEDHIKELGWLKALPHDSPEAQASRLVNIVTVLEMPEYEHIVEMMNVERDCVFIGCSLSVLCRDDRIFGAMVALCSGLVNVKWVDAKEAMPWLRFYYKHQLVTVEDTLDRQGLKIGEQFYRVSTDLTLHPIPDTVPALKSLE